MRAMWCAAVAVLALAACNPSAPSGENGAQNPVAQAASSVFPNLFSTAYRAEATITGTDGTTLPVVMIRDGSRMRMEMTTPAGPVASIVNRETGDAYSIMHVMGRTMVTRINISEADRGDMWWDGSDSTVQMTNVGGCSHLGETGTEWARGAADGPQHVCVTGDGIILWATDNGRTTWQTTSVVRGAQDASLFALPEGVPVTDLGQMNAGMAQALEAAKTRAGQ